MDDDEEEMSTNGRRRIPLDPALASSSPLISSTSTRRSNINNHHRRQPTGFHEKQLDTNESRSGGSDSIYIPTTQQQQQQQQQQQRLQQRQTPMTTTIATTTMKSASSSSAAAGRRSITLRLLEETTPPPPAPQPKPPTPFRQSPLISSVQSFRRLRSISLSGRAFAVISNAAAAAINAEANGNAASASASCDDAVVDATNGDVVHPLARESGKQQQQQRKRIIEKDEGENTIDHYEGAGEGEAEGEKVKLVDRGIIVISWYDGTTSHEMREHVHNCVLRKLNDTRKKTTIGGGAALDGGPVGGGGGDIKLADVRLLDEHGEVVLCPFLPDGSTFVLKFKITVDGPPAPSLGPPPSAVKDLGKQQQQSVSLPPWYVSRAPESPSAEPSLHRRFADRTLPDGTIVPSSLVGDRIIVRQDQDDNAPPQLRHQHQQPQQHLEMQQMLSAVAALLLRQQQAQQQAEGGMGSGRMRNNEHQHQSPQLDSNSQSDGQLPSLRDDEKKEDDEDTRPTCGMSPKSNNSPVANISAPPAPATLPSTTTDRLIEEQLRQLNELFLLRRHRESNYVQSNDGDGASCDGVVVATSGSSKALPEDQDHQANLVRAYRRNEKRQVIFMISNYLLLFLSLIALSAEIQSRLPQWMLWVQQNYDSVQNCATDQEALLECLSNGDFGGLVASFLLWATQSASAKRIFLFGFDTPKKLWTVVYEALVTAVCWGTSYIFIRRGLNPNTRQNFLQLYWKDAVYGSLAGFNAAFMKAVLKNLVPQEVALEALDGRQLRIRHWIHWLMTDE
ncbi:hypothetical protein ACHAXA_009823 [Cyclostephanos tholiformis]|uniref:Uncharacterized protein n=1 Tax=Cyclostephanos tholiformis TaxID=382380 RepID=A0ABD3R9K5_9STRA